MSVALARLFTPLSVGVYIIIVEKSYSDLLIVNNQATSVTYLYVVMELIFIFIVLCSRHHH